MKLIKLLTIIITAVAVSACMLTDSDSLGSENSNVEYRIKNFVAEPYALSSGVSTAVTFNWDYSTSDMNNAECFISGTEGTITSGTTIEMSITEDTELLLECDKNQETYIAAATLSVAQAPIITSLNVFPPVMEINTPGTASFTWNLADGVYPEPDCTLEGNNVTQEDNGRVYTLEGAEGGQFYELSCTNAAGTDSETVYIESDIMTEKGVAKTALAAGNTLTWGHVQVDIPAGALAEDTDITVNTSTPFEGADNLIHYPISFLPEGLHFSAPVTVTVTYDDTILPDGVAENDLGMSYFNNGVWVDISSTVDTSNNTITYELSHFSDYAASNQPPEPPIKSHIATLVKGTEAVFVSKYHTYKYKDDASDGYAESSLPVNSDISAILENRIESVSCDIDADGREESVILSLNDSGSFEFFLYEADGSGNFFVSDKVLSSDLESRYWRYADIDCANFDGGADSELVVVAADGTGYSKLWVFKYGQTGNDVIQHGDVLYFGDPRYGFIQQSFNDDAMRTQKLYSNVRVAVGNFDDDEKDEIAVFGFYPYKYAYGYWKPKIILFDDADNSYNYYSYIGYSSGSNIFSYSQRRDDLQRISGTYTTYGPLDSIDIVAGNFVDDSNEEVAVVGYNYQERHTSQRGFSEEQMYYSDPVHYTEVYDNPNSPEQFTLKYSDEFENAQSRKYYGGVSNYSYYPFGNDYSYNQPVGVKKDYSLRAGDFNADGIDEVVSVIGLSTNNNYRYSICPVIISPTLGELNASSRFRAKYSILEFEALASYYNDYEEDYSFSMNFDVGDVDNDGYDELISKYGNSKRYSQDKGIVHKAVFFKGESGPYGTYKFDFKAAGSFDLGDEYSKFRSASYVLAGDYDGDNISVMYDHVEADVSLDLMPLVIISEAPSWLGDIQGDGSTTFTNKESTQYSQKNTMTSSLGVTVGAKFEADAFGTVFSIGCNATWTKSLTRSTTSSVKTTGIAGYTTGAEDKIVYSAAKVDVYYYQVLSHPDIENMQEQSDGKKYISINIPKKNDVYHDSISSFNNSNGSLPDIDETLLRHTIGDPTSYPSGAEASALISENSDKCGADYTLPCSRIVDPQAIGSSDITGSMTIGFDMGTSVDDSVNTMNISSGSQEYCAGSVCLGISADTGTGIGFSTTTDKSIAVSGTINDIDESYNPAKRYKAGMFMYYDIYNTNKVMMINYIFEPI